MSTPFQDLDPAGPSPEDRVNALRGYKAYVSFFAHYVLVENKFSSLWLTTEHYIIPALRNLPNDMHKK